jgi:hypothetical protein
MKDSADPLDGRNAIEVHALSFSPAKNDIYGKLFHHMQKHLHQFCCRVA